MISESNPNSPLAVGLDTGGTYTDAVWGSFSSAPPFRRYLHPAAGILRVPGPGRFPA
jgi:hypothetical protein